MKAAILIFFLAAGIASAQVVTPAGVGTANSNGSVVIPASGTNQYIGIKPSGNGYVNTPKVLLTALNSDGSAAGNPYLDLTNGFVNMKSTTVIGWTSIATAQFTTDTGLARNAAGVVEVNTSTAGTFADLLARGVRSNAVTFSNKIASPVEGTIQAFTDSTTATWGDTITGSGSNHVLGYFDGTNWTVMGK